MKSDRKKLPPLLALDQRRKTVRHQMLKCSEERLHAALGKIPAPVRRW